MGCISCKPVFVKARNIRDNIKSKYYMYRKKDIIELHKKSESSNPVEIKELENLPDDAIISEPIFSPGDLPVPESTKTEVKTNLVKEDVKIKEPSIKDNDNDNDSGTGSDSDFEIVSKSELAEPKTYKHRDV
jgi:hypothetical protein